METMLCTFLTNNMKMGCEKSKHLVIHETCMEEYWYSFIISNLIVSNESSSCKAGAPITCKMDYDIDS
jgi:hypothetical protein